MSPIRIAARVGLLVAHDHLEQRGLADAVRADDADQPVARQREAQPVDQHPVAEALAQVGDLDHLVTQPRARRNLDLLEVQLAVLVRLGRHLLVALQPGLALGLAGPRAGADPLQLLLQPLAPLGVLRALDLDPGRLGLQVGGVVALVGVGVAPVQLEDPLRHVVQEVPVVGDRDDGPGILLQVLLQPLHALRVQVVGGLVQQQQVRLGQQQLAQRDPAALSPGQHGHIGIRGRAAQCVHGLLKLAVQVPGVAVIKLLLELAHLVQQLIGVIRRHLLGDLVVLVQQGLGLRHPVLDVAQHGLALIKLRLLAEQPHREAGEQPGIAVGRMLQPGHHLQQGRLARAVGPDHTDLGPGEERQRYVIKKYLVALHQAGGMHLIDKFRHAPRLGVSAQRVGRPGLRGERADPVPA